MRRVPIHQSLIRPALVLGAERDLVLWSGLVAFLVGMGGFTLVSAAVGFLWWVCTVFVLRRMARKDPMLSRVWLRHIRQQDFYPARAGGWRFR